LRQEPLDGCLILAFDFILRHVSTCRPAGAQRQRFAGSMKLPSRLFFATLVEPVLVVHGRKSAKSL
jgi:hypothetical protein